MSAGLPPHPRDGEAAEYVLGTLPASEREAFRREVEADPRLLRLVLDWERRLSPLAERIEPVRPSAELWSRIIAQLPQDHALRAAETRPASRKAGEVVAWPKPTDISRLRRSRAIWRGGALAASALAAMLAIYVAVSGQAGPGPSTPDLFAVVNRGGDLPALVVRVDQKTGTVQIRTVAAETPADHSLELWSIVGSGPPRSLGVIGSGTTRVALPGSDRGGALEGATVAVSVEPVGGSKTGAPTGPVVYSGKLIKDGP